MRLTRTSVFILLTLVIAVAGLAVLYVASRNKIPRPAPGARDRGYLASPDGRFRVRVFTTDQGALGWGRIWVYGPVLGGKDDLMVSGKLQDPSSLPVVWISNAAFEIETLDDRDNPQLFRFRFVEDAQGVRCERWQP